MISEALLHLLAKFDLRSMVTVESDGATVFHDPRQFRHRNDTMISTREVDILARVSRVELTEAINRILEVAARAQADYVLAAVTDNPNLSLRQILAAG